MAKQIQQSFLMGLNARQHSMLRLLLSQPGLSRAQLTPLFDVNKMTIGRDVQQLIDMGLLRETGRRIIGRGRPQVELELDSRRREILGIAISKGAIEGGRCNILGEPLGEVIHRPTTNSDEALAAMRDIIAAQASRRTLSIAVTAPGFLDAQQRTLLLTSAFPNQPPIDLNPVFKGVKDSTILLQNDMFGVAARWVLLQRSVPADDTLFIRLDDGQLGAALMVGGRPNAGCVIGANELGHTRVSDDETPCYCGQRGCVERIVSTDYLAAAGLKTGTLADILIGHADHPAVQRVMHALTQAVANAVNFTRIARVVLISQPLKDQSLFERFSGMVQAKLLGELRKRLQIQHAPDLTPASAHSAGAIGALQLYLGGELIEHS